jgi:predicted ferric reductase
VRPGLLLGIYITLMLAPLGLAAAQGKPARFFRDELASGLALVAFAVLIVEFVLSGRFRVISERMGMDVTMRFHQLLARSALAALILHPFLYASPIAAVVPWDVSRRSTIDLGGASVATGLLAWVFLPTLVLTAIHRERLGWKYETWRLTHGLGALLVALASTHHVISAGRYSAEPLLAGFWLILLGLAAFSLAWVYVIKPLGQCLKPYAVRSVRRLTPRAWEVVIEPEGHAGLDFKAGQFVWLNIGRSPFSLYENPFSISSCPSDRPAIAFLIQEAGDFTRGIGAVARGTRAHLDGPHGNLTLENRRGKGVALIAGGVGIAPLIGILRDLGARRDERPVILIYGARNEREIAYRDELDALGRRPTVAVHYVLNEPPDGWAGRSGIVDAACLEALFSFPEARDWLFVLCGPPPMMDAAEDTLIAMGVPAHQIVSERFRYD